MSIGLQMAQIVHGAVEFCLKFPEITKAWHDISNYVAVLSVDNEEQLLLLIRKAGSRNIKYVEFREPDQDDAVTAVVLEPGLDSRRITSHIALAGKYNEASY